MLVSTEPRGMFQYSVWPIVLSLLMFVILVVVYIIIVKHKSRPVLRAQPVAIVVDLAKTQSEFLAQIDGLVRDFQNRSITNRQAYQGLSRLIRQFVFRVTGIKVQNYTLSEIKKVNISSLTELVAEYYSPEFASGIDGDFLTSAAKTRKVIEAWH